MLRLMRVASKIPLAVLRAMGGWKSDTLQYARSSQKLNDIHTESFKSNRGKVNRAHYVATPENGITALAARWVPQDAGADAEASTALESH